MVQYARSLHHRQNANQVHLFFPQQRGWLSARCCYPVVLHRPSRETGYFVLVLKGGEVVGPRLSLLNQYFPGYRVSALGSVIGLGYGFVSGFVLGWTFALLRNCVVFFSRAVIHRRSERAILKKLLEYI